MPGSKVSGAIIEGIFQGTISIPSEKEVYHIEKSNRFFWNKPGFHSIVYKESHMNLDPFRYVLAWLHIVLFSSVFYSYDLINFSVWFHFS